MNTVYKSVIIGCAALISSWSTVTAQIATEAVKTDFEARREALKGTDYLKIFDRSDLTPEQREGLEVLYAYMIWPDITDYTGEYFLENVDVALRGRKELPWGSKVPDREFRHFVLPVRVNNEALDGHRKIFYEELLPRIQGMTMEEAILEINHWCHEKATYQPSDGRTHSPLMTVYSAIGRCGEESTFTVAALRAMGIPARQVYTPRWAHTDDNHAWVEAWADGKWHFLGACEPEAVLDLGWFNAPAARGMLMNTRVFGRYDGPEEVLGRVNGYTDINVTSNYAPTDTVRIKVTAPDGTPIENAEVTFRLYNYAEFYPIATKKTDREGRATLLAGLGDLLIWGSDGKGNYGFAKVSNGQGGETAITITPGSDRRLTMDLDVTPPPVASRVVQVPEEKAAENARRFAREDSIRGAYTATFANDKDAEQLAGVTGLDKERLAKVLTDSRGNHRVVKEFLTGLDKADRERGLRLLEVIAEKDRSDIPLEILRDHMATKEGSDSPLYAEYILNPRVGNEMTEAYRKYFRKEIRPADAERYRRNPELWADWVRDNIDGTEQWSSTVIMLPTSVWQSRLTNAISRDIFFVASARSLGIPAQVDPVNGKPMWADAQGDWHEAIFDAPKGTKASPKGTLATTYTKTGRIDDPKYYSHFTLSQMKEGQPSLLTYPDFAGWSETLADGETLDAGEYMLVTGQRMADGGVLARIEMFPVKEGKTVSVPVTMRQDPNGVQVIGSFDAESLYHDLKSGTDKSVLSTTGRGYYVIKTIRGGHEQTNHTLRDISSLNDELEKWGRPMILLLSDGDESKLNELPPLPSTVVTGTDIDGKITRALTEALKLPENDLPVFIIADTFNRVVFVTSGYTIGLGERLVDTIHKLK